MGVCLLDKIKMLETLIISKSCIHETIIYTQKYSTTLSLAMQGKLVKQDKKDQPAGELLKEIEAEKKRLVNEGNIRKQQDLPEINKNEIPYEVPLGWEWVRLIEISDYNGRPNAAPDEISPDTWVLDLEDIEKETSIILNRAIYAERNSKSTKSTFCKGDVLYGKLRPYLDKVVVADKDGVCTTEIVPIVPFKGIDSYFLKALLKRPSFIAHVNELSYGVKMPRLGTADALKSIHPLPPLAEQKRIVAKIDQLMSLCDKLETQRNKRSDKRLKIHTAAIHGLLSAPDKSAFNSSWNFITKNFSELYCVQDNVEELKKAILQLAVMGKLVKQDPKDQPAGELLKEIEAEKKVLIKGRNAKPQKQFDDISSIDLPYVIPNGWQWVRFDEIALHNSGKTLDSGRNVGQLHDYITTSNLYWGRFLFENNRQMPIKDEELVKCSAKKGDLLICEGGEAGRAAVWSYDHDVCFQNHIHRARFYGGISAYYAYRFFEKLNATGEINNYRKGVGISNMSSKSLGSIIFPLPPLAEQKRIVAKIDQLMSLCNSLEKDLKNSSDKQTAILNAVLAKI
jgi:type I restriction enzyme S subunit